MVLALSRRAHYRLSSYCIKVDYLLEMEEAIGFWALRISFISLWYYDCGDTFIPSHLVYLLFDTPL